MSRHFFHITQVKNNLNILVSSFLNRLKLTLQTHLPRWQSLLFFVKIIMCLWLLTQSRNLEERDYFSVQVRFSPPNSLWSCSLPHVNLVGGIFAVVSKLLNFNLQKYTPIRNISINFLPLI